MHNKFHSQTEDAQKLSSILSHTPVQGMFEVRSVVVQQKRQNNSQLPDLKTSLKRAEKYGHKPNQILSVDIPSIATPIQPKMEMEGRANQLPIQFVKLSGTKNPPFIKNAEKPNLGKEDKDLEQNMHFFWSGNSPGRTGQGKEFDNLKKWAEANRKQGDSWKMNLWTDEASYEKWHDKGADKNIKEQIDQLKKLGINVQSVEDQIDKRNKHVYDHAIKHNVPTMASDVARYNVLHNQGGIYADLDLTPGENFNFPSGEALKSGKLPFVGPRIQDESSLGGKQLNEVIEDKYTSGQFGNHLIAAEKGNKTMNKAIDKIGEIKILSEEKNPNLSTKYLTDNQQDLKHKAPEYTGPGLLGNVMAHQLREKSNQSGDVKGAYEKMNPNLKQAFDKINWLTDASNDKGEKR